MSTSTPTADNAHPHKETAKETVISVLIAFIMAFVFRSFVVEAFIIPTGSMAPTLNGAHMRFTDPQSGYQWAVGPRDYADPGANQNPLPFQGSGGSPIVVHDPITGKEISQAAVPRRAGDRILVLKYLYGICNPERFDIVVFKNPTEPSVNYIKRLIGLPGEQITIVDGDVYARDSKLPMDSRPLWEQDGWKIQRKPHHVQQTVWQCIYDTHFTPADPARVFPFGTPFTQPWAGEGWTSSSRGEFTFGGTKSGSTTSTLTYDTTAPMGSNSGGRVRQIVDRLPYNEMSQGQALRFVSDLRIRASVQPSAATDERFTFSMIVKSRGHEFRGRITGGKCFVEFRPDPTDAVPDPKWTELATGDASLDPARATPVEFWHSDQRLELWINGKLATHGLAEGCYDWTPAQRIRFAMTPESYGWLNSKGSEKRAANDQFATQAPQIMLQCNAPVKIVRLGLDRDVFYQAFVANYRVKWGESVEQGGLGTLPSRPLTLLDDQYFCLGDNSPGSSDGRYWGMPDPWVSDLMGRRGMPESSQDGVVPGDLMLGKAFFVYFPAPTGDGWAWWVPDFGRLRFID